MLSDSNAPIAVLTNGKNWRFYLLEKEGDTYKQQNFFMTVILIVRNLNAVLYSLGKISLKR